MKINEKEFKAFLELRKIGVCNMLDPYVREFCNIDKEQHIYIVKNFEKLLKKFEEEEC